jgi:hypothetical protein
LKTWEGDLKEYKDVYKKYTEQLVKVKVSIVKACLRAEYLSVADVRHGK